MERPGFMSEPLLEIFVRTATLMHTVPTLTDILAVHVIQGIVEMEYLAYQTIFSVAVKSLMHFAILSKACCNARAIRGILGMV